MESRPIVQVDGLVKDYGRIRAVDNVSFAVGRGEIFGLLGPNGAGKTTIISILSCLVPPTTGTAHVAGHDVTRDSIEVRSRIGVVPQEIALYQTLSARENLLFWGRMYGLSGDALSRRAGELIDVVGLSERADTRIDTFSGGMKRRINIAVGLLHDPEVLFLDEPTVGIDPQTRRSLLDLARDLNDQGLTILYTTHYLEEAEFLCDRVGIVDGGKLIAIGTQRELVAQIGATDTITVEADGIDAARLAALDELPGVLETSVDDRVAKINAESGSRLLPTLVERLTESGVAIRSVEVDAPNLESVFLHLTGRSLGAGQESEGKGAS
ncbi:MAG: ATP-binding cassette domain-containing protein [Candidatus Eisenbacteria bacterium]|nr:ATP-binding cassette domain-containing protein [Candidatus Eisenbacteria bacterium]